MRLWYPIALAVAALLLPAQVKADERILSYESDVAVQPDSSLLVSETITVRAEGVQIRRGIYRDFPTRYEGPRGGRVRVGFELLGVTRNGAPEPAAAEPIGNGVRIRIGQEDVFLAPADYRYVIRYRTTRQVGRFADFDELYWNVTGNGWDFPIDQASVRITLPRPVKFGQRAVYTGLEGSTDAYARVVDERPGEIRFQSTAPLGPRQGMTVAVAWPKGVIAAETADESARHWLADNGPTIVGTLALLGLLGYYFYAWKRVGRGPLAGTVVPIFSPPDELTPAAMRYVWKMKADNRSFAAALVDMGVRGHVRLVEEDGGWLSKDKTRIERLAAANALPVAEEAMLRELAATGDSIVMDNDNHAKFSSAQKALSASLKNSYEGKLFLRNWSWSLIGLALFVAALGLTALALLLAEGSFDPTVIGSSALPLLLPLLAVPFVISAFAWMAAPTKEGRGVLDRIAGFRQYLSIAERNRLDRMSAPADTLDRFERFLPYAIALGVETRWAKRFQSQLAAAAVAQGTAHGFAWYSGSSSPWDNPGGFAERMGSSLSSAISSASTAPGSSSGSGGGGSSGGGGGGGGGGGW